MTSEYLVEQANAESSDDPLITLVTLSHTLLEEPIRCALNNVDVASRGNTYKVYPFDFVPPEQTREGFRPGHLRIDNIDGVIVETLRLVAGSGEEPVLTFEFVWGSDTDEVEKVWPLLILQNARYDDVVEGDLTLPDLAIEPLPGFSFTPNLAPGLIY